MRHRFGQLFTLLYLLRCCAVVINSEYIDHELFLYSSTMLSGESDFQHRTTSETKLIG